ncbi:MAG TPA: methyltransferase domain-containing protein [Burkholderiales bacterium]|nr:methyltransferase domain-containing protein [Burkholderiales bacterium]
MSTADVYRITDRLDDPTLDALVARLEARGRHPRFLAMLHEYLDAMAIDSAATVVDLGCGSGVVARTIARRPGFAGRVTGIDRSPYLIAAAGDFARREGVDRAVEFRTGDSHALALPDAAFDAVVAHTLLSHVEDPRAVMQEIARLVKPGGRAAIFDGDYASLTYGGGDPIHAKAMDETIVDALTTNPRVMREMPQLLRDCGLTLVKSFAYVIADIGKADYFAPGIQALLRLLPSAGATTESEARDWVAAMMKRSDEGTYFGASNFYSYVATRV